MNFFTLETIQRLFAPHHELSCSWFLWRRLIAGLKQRGRHRSRESGAFLLGHRRSGRTRITAFVLYDDLDPKCLDTGIVRFDGRYFGSLWDLCKRRGLSVIADVHVHPGCADQSDSDRAHPMISRSGHLALIVPNFADGQVRASNIGIYRYMGAKCWQAVPAERQGSFFHIGL